jgi:hypothetical protein
MFCHCIPIKPEMEARSPASSSFHTITYMQLLAGHCCSRPWQGLHCRTSLQDSADLLLSTALRVSCRIVQACQGWMPFSWCTCCCAWSVWRTSPPRGMTPQTFSSLSHHVSHTVHTVLSRVSSAVLQLTCCPMCITAASGLCSDA